MTNEKGSKVEITNNGLERIINAITADGESAIIAFKSGSKVYAGARGDHYCILELVDLVNSVWGEK